MEVEHATRECASEGIVRKYVPRRMLEQQDNAEVSNEEVFLRKLKGIFNKMCPKTFDAQVVEIVDTLQEISTNKLSPQVWHSIAKFILQRAIMEPNFHTIKDEREIGEWYLKAFALERILTTEATKLVGELGKRSQMFSSPSILVRPATLLLAFLDDPKFTGSFSGIHNMSVECACTLLNLIGKCADMTPNEPVCVITTKIFDTVQQLGENKSISPRLRFMAKDLSELRSNRWLPRVLTKNADAPSPSPSPSTSASPAPSVPQIIVPSSGVCKERNDEAHEMSMEDAELFSAMENFVQKLNGKSESCVSNVLRKFVKSIPQDNAKLLALVFSETPELAALALPLQSPRSSDKFFIRRSASQVLAKGSNSPQPLSRHFHAIINLIKLNNSASLSEDVSQSLVTKVETLRACELIEVVGSIFRKMCEMPEEYPYCLNICLTLASNTRTVPHSFQETLETCCQDETALKMFNTQASLKTYLQLVHDLEKQLHIDSNIVKRCVGNVQKGLYELTEHEAGILASLEAKISPSSSTTTTPTAAPSPAPFTSAKLTPTAVNLPPDPFATYTPKDEEPPRVEETKCGSEEQEQTRGLRSRSADGDWSRRC